jgi:hypothetical protein
MMLDALIVMYDKYMVIVDSEANPQRVLFNPFIDLQIFAISSVYCPQCGILFVHPQDFGIQ